MKLFGIFDKNQNYKLLRYSTANQLDAEYDKFDISTNQYVEVSEVCLPDIEYSEENIGKSYDINSKQFLV